MNTSTGDWLWAFWRERFVEETWSAFGGKCLRYALLAGNVDLSGKTFWRENTSYEHFSHFLAKTFPPKCFPAKTPGFGVKMQTMNILTATGLVFATRPRRWALWAFFSRRLRRDFWREMWMLTGKGVVNMTSLWNPRNFFSQVRFVLQAELA